ncbi:ATP-binding cassette domain-containing protein [Roseomonas stagni]|uniref:ATP-binding cassette domain-containing protein n=1 Tax=Falsiroseomonas algicola TaxID=2716930 RepID=A0A6M1LGP0_9PROT|nr:ATP-binding cassette domain-containing protein [Falsiroseomonas algicola]NGM19505.1 ATP-binding cassette domain-containing protein [Falsiroseomonas algicola]
MAMRRLPGPSAAPVPGAAPLAARGVMEVARAEMGVAMRFTLWLGIVLALAGFGVTVSKMMIWQVVLPTGNPWTLSGLAILLCIAIAMNVALDQLREVGLLAVSHRLARRMAAPLVMAAAQQPGRSDISAGQALRDVEELRRNVAGPVLTGVVDAVIVPLLILLLLYFHWAFAVFALALCLIAAILSLVGERLTRRALIASNDAHAQTSGLVADAMRCAESVEAMGMRQALATSWEARMEESATALRGAQNAGRWIGAALATVSGIGTGGALVLGTVLAANGANIGMGALVCMLTMSQILGPFTRLGGAVTDWADALAAWQRLQGLSRADRGPDNAIAFPCREGRLVMERVSFAHRGAPRALLRDVQLVVEPGRAVAISGTAGAGKTTLLRIAVGMVKPSAGGCFLDGQSTSQWQREDFARHVGYLPQDPLLTDGTVAEAIARLAAPDMQAVMEAARLADAAAMIAGLPMGYATPIRAEGPLSAGQRQRVALARALYGRPKLLVMDEPAAFLDAEGEQRLVRLIRRLTAEGMGILFTSHRPALLAAADRVLVLRGGQLAPAPLTPAIAGPAPRRPAGEAA